MKDINELRVRYGQFTFNKISVMDMVLSTKASGKLATALYVDHSCTPKTCIFYDGLQMTIRATKNIAASEPIYATYLPLLGRKAFRRAILD